MTTEGQEAGLYRVDVRVFLVVMTSAMAMSFLAGISLAPAPQAPSAMKDTLIHSSPANPKVHDEFFKISQEELDSTDDEEHLPAGQHLLVDIEGVDEAFLNSEERLSKAMVDTVTEAGLHMLSYHCHALIPAGVSCVGVLLESHISFHTWPAEGVITLDLFTCGGKPLLPAVETIERLFGIPSNKPGHKLHTQWSHELRGFRPEEEVKKNYLADSSDLSLWVLSPLEMYSKELIYSGRTKFQQVDVWDVVELTDTPSYQDAIKHNMTAGDPRLKMPEYVTPDRLLFLDGTAQSVSSSEPIYHEAMVHPAMFAHPGPKNVVILGGGEGATLREVLKHQTLEAAVMLEIDEELVSIAREHLSSMSDCSDLIGRADNCFDDDIATVFYADGRQWFIDRYGPAAKLDPEYKEVDVVLVDALDPEDESEISDLLYNDENFVNSLVNSLSDDGILAIQVGTAATIDDPRPDFGIYKQREFLFNALESNPSIEAMFVYEEPHAGFLEPHGFLIACKSVDCRSRWYSRSDQVDFQIYERIVRTKSKKRALSLFDGTTQRSYQWPKRGWETVYCRREPTPFECAYRTMGKAELHELDLDNDEASSFRVETFKDENGETTTKLFATEEIPEGSFIMAEHLASSLMITSRNIDGLKSNLEVGGGRVSVIDDLLNYFEIYAHESAAAGSSQHYVEVGGTVLIRRSEDESEVNVGRWLPSHPSGSRPKYSPVYERHRVSFDVFIVATKTIAEGEEVVMSSSLWSE